MASWAEEGWEAAVVAVAAEPEGSMVVKDSAAEGLAGAEEAKDLVASDWEEVIEAAGSAAAATVAAVKAAAAGLEAG